MSDADDLWIEMAQFDTSLADGLWEGSPPPGDAPAWYGKVSALIHAASAPAGSSELAGEATTVARMQAAVVEAATDPPQHLAAGRSAAHRRHQGHGARLVGRIVAVKAAAFTTAVVLGVTAAAATTGIVATVVVPALQDRDEPTVEESPATVVDQGGGSSGGFESPGGSDGSSPFDCVLRPETCGHGGVGLVGAGGSTGANGDDPAGAATEPGATDSDATTGVAVGDATEATGDGMGTATTVAPLPDETPTEATTTTTEPPPTTTTTEPPPTTTTTEPPAPLVDESAASTAETQSMPVTPGDGDGAGTPGPPAIGA